MRSLPLISLIACLSSTGIAFADEAAAPPRASISDSEDPLEVHGNEILVRAPRIRGQLDVPQQPIQVFEEQDIAAYGVNSIAELLDAISPQTGSGRGRGDGHPVMLLNGQRISGFREMRNIPPEAIRRMEILPEEVALRFGYPANQRVVNIILKDRFAALTAAGEYNRPTRGGYDNHEVEGGLFRIAGPRRYNVAAKLTGTTMLTEAERAVLQEDPGLPVVATDPDPARFRSLSAASSEFNLEGTMTQGLGENGLGGSITASAGYTRSRTLSLSGLDSLTLDDGDGAVQRYLPDPLATRSISDRFEGGFGFSRFLGNWELSATADGSYTDTATRSDRRRDDAIDALVAAARAGTLAIDGPLPAVPGAGVDLARNRALALDSLVTLSGRPFRLPAGEASLTVKAGYGLDRTRSEDSRSSADATRLTRGDAQAGVNLALPLAGDDFLGAVGDLSVNLSAGVDHLSDFGTLRDWSAGLSWSPTDRLNFQASYLVNEEAPALAQLGAPTILTYNVPVYDFDRGSTALVTVTSGGNPGLKREKQRDIKLSAMWKLPVFDHSNLMVEYFRNRSSDVTQGFPLLTPAIEAAFPDRVLRDASGRLVALDRRAVTFDEVSGSRLRWGFNLSGSLGGSSARAAPATPASAATPAPAANAAAAAGAGRPGFDPQRFAAIRARFCPPATAEPDLATLPEALRARLVGPDGRPDPAKMAQFRARVCSAEAPAGGFDPERLARMRTLLCGEGVPDPATLPERMAERLRGPDGQIDKARLAEMRERICRADGMPAPPDGPPAAGPGGGRMAAGGPGGPGGPPPPMMMGGGRRGMGSRWNIAVYHTWRFADRVRIAPGVAVLDQLAGDAIAAGGVPRHAIEAEGGLFRNGYGLRFKAQWQAPAMVNGTGLPGSSDLRFGSTFDINLRLFADLGRNEDLVARIPFLKGARVSLVADNLLDSRQRVIDGSGQVPIAYQAAFREPEGRVVGIDFRKMF